MITQAEVNAYWDRRPCNVRHSDKPVGSAEYFEEVAAKRYFVEPHIVDFAQFGRWAGKRVFEIGCGIGTDGAEFVKAGADYMAVDASEEACRIARMRGLSIGQPFEYGWADLAYSFGVIHHAEDPKALIREARRVIREDGEFRLMLYAKNSYKAALIEAGLAQPEAQAGCPIARMYDEASVRELLRPYFSVESIEQAHIFPWQIEPYKRGEYVKEPWFEAMPEAAFKAMEKRLGWHLLIVARPL